MESVWWQGQGGPAAVAVLTVTFSLGLALLALWVALPVAVLGVRSALRDLVSEQRAAARELAEIRRALETLAAGRVASPREDAAPPP